MKFVMDPEQLTSAACKRRAAELMAHAEAPYDKRAGIPGAESSSFLVAKAQVWATLATVPEPPEPVYATLDSTLERPQIALTFNDLPRLPVVRCPHGVTAAIIPDDAGGQESLRYTFALCEECQ